MKTKLSFVSVAILALALVLTGCGKADNAEPAPAESARDIHFTMGTVAELTIHGPGAEAAVEDIKQILDDLTVTVDRFTPESDIDRINKSGGGPVTVSIDTALLIDHALTWAEQTGGAFDLTVAPLIDLWGFIETDDSLPADITGPTAIIGRQPPPDADIQQLLPFIGYKNVAFNRDDRQVELLQPETQLDLGGIAKGYAADVAAELLRQRGISSALINLGGDMYALGTKPDGIPWRIGVADPRQPSEIIAVVPITDRAIVTSGDYERYFEYEGVRYTHLVDPRTGYPQHHLSSVTIVAPTATAADVLATAVSVLGLDEGMELLNSLTGVEGMLIDTAGKVHMTKGLQQTVELRPSS